MCVQVCDDRADICLTFCIEGQISQMSQNATQRDVLVSPADLRPHEALSSDKIKLIRVLNAV